MLNRAVALIVFSFGWSELAAKVPEASWTQLEERFNASQEKYQEAKEGKKEELEQGAISYLRSLLHYESAARILASDEDTADGLAKIREFSSQERRSIQKLRQEIREEEQERLVSALAADTDLAADEDAAESLLKNEMRLDSFFKKNTRKLASEITKLERQLGKIQKQKIRNQAAQERVEGEIAELKEKITESFAAVYGFRQGIGFRELADEGVKGAGSTLLSQIIAEREQVFAFLKGEESEGTESEGKAATVGGSFLYSSNLGVVLDVSGSMTEHLEELRDEINSYFEAPRFREVVGCRLDSCHFEHLRTRRQPDTWATMSVIEELITVREVDTVYWFSDLQDDQSHSSVRRLRELLMRGGTRFHVKSLGKKPSRELDDIITDFQD